MLVTFKMITLFITFCFIGVCTGNMGAPEQEEPTFVLFFDSPLHVCTDPESLARVDTSGVEVINFNETLSFLSGTIDFREQVGHNTMVELIVEKEVSGQYEIMLTHEICNLCEELHPDSVYYKYLVYFGFPKECPFPLGGYQIHDFVPPSDDMPVNSSNTGRYQVTVNFYLNPDGSCKNEKTFLFCLKCSFVIEQSLK